jgi:hypothetical protein
VWAGNIKVSWSRRNSEACRNRFMYMTGLGVAHSSKDFSISSSPGLLLKFSDNKRVECGGRKRKA